MLIIPRAHGLCLNPLMCNAYWLEPIERTGTAKSLRQYPKQYPSSILSVSYQYPISILEETLIPTVNPCYDLHPRRKITWRHAPSIVLRTLQGVLFNPIIFMTFLGILVNVIVYFGVNKQVGVRQLPGNNDCC